MVMVITKQIQEKIDDQILNYRSNEFGFCINLSQLGLTEIPPEIFLLNDLVELNLSKNCLSFIPTEIQNLKELSELNLSDNQIEKFPEILLSLPELWVLNLANNKISQIPEYVLNFQMISSLSLKNNPITIPDLHFDFENENFTTISHWLRKYYQKEKPKSNILKIPNQLKTSIKQYLNFFPDFVLQSKGVKINFEVATVEEGLSLQIYEKDEDSINQINTYLQEYMGFLQNKNEALSILFTKPATDFEKQLLLTNQKLQIRNLESALEIKSLEISYLKEILKQPILLSHSLIETLHNATIGAQNNLRANKIPVPFIQDGYLWQQMPDGKNIQLEKLEPLKSA